MVWRPRRLALNHDPSDFSRVPRDFGPYRVLHQIGVGVLGPVFRAQAGGDGVVVAVKALRLDIPPEQAAEVTDGLVALRAVLPDDPGLVDLLAAGLEGETPWLAMRLLDDATLDTRLRDGRPADLASSLAGIRDLASAMDAAHGYGMFHGNLHPRDVFVGPDGRSCVTGFGIGRVLAGVGVRPAPRRPYAAPELLAGAPLEQGADLFALGVLAFEWLTGRRPSGLGGDAAAHFAVPGAPEEGARARTIIAAMLAEQPEHRPDTATAFAQALASALDVAVRPRARVAAAVGLADTEGPTTVVDRSPSVTLEPPSDDALRIFATQGTLWEAPRPVEEWRQEVHEEDDGEPASRQLPSDRTVLELPPPRRSDSDRPPPSPRPAVGLMTAPAAVPELRQAVPPADLTLLPMESAREAPDSLAEDRTLVMGAAHAPDATASGTFHGRATPAVDEPAPEASAPPAVVLMLTLALGLAIGGAGGYLLGQRSAARLQGPTTVALPPEEPRAPESAPGASERAAGDESSPRPAPTVPPPAAAAARQSPPPGRDGAAVAGELTVRSMPAKAGVIVNNVWRGRSPLTLRGLPLGTHTVRVVERGYSPETRRVVLDGRVPAATVSVQLARAEPERAAAAPAPTPGATTGSLYIESRPPGARVFVDGSLVGSTPLLLSGIKPGARDVRLEHPGHRAWTATVEITAGQRQRVAASLEEGS